MSSAEGSVNWLPEELILEVFLRLPRKSLLRSKCVSKGLRDSINSPIFKKRYDIFHNSVTDFAVIIPEDDMIFSIDFHLPDDLYSSREKEVSIPYNKPTRFTGCCKGIVCLLVSEVSVSFILLNPFNGTFQFVEGGDLCKRNNLFRIGFGYDYDADDYKIVVWDPYGHAIIKYLYVYSLRRDSWEQVAVEFRLGFSTHFIGICVESAIHWLWFHESVYTCIAAFDLRTNAWRSLPLPPLIGTRKLRLTLYDFGGRLCVSGQPLHPDPDSSSIVWVMEEYGVETSWTPLFSIGNPIQVIGYFPMCDSVRLLCFGLDSRLWSWLNTQDGSNENIQIHKLPRKQGYNDVHRYEAISWVCVRNPLRLPFSELQND